MITFTSIKGPPIAKPTITIGIAAKNEPKNGTKFKNPAVIAKATA